MPGPTSPKRDPYRRIARYYDSIIDPLNAGVRRVVHKLDPPQPGWSVLDVGCGTGTALEQYAQAGCRVAGADVSASMLERARQRLGPEAELHLAHGAELPFEVDRFDRVVASMMLHEVPASERAALVSEMRRVVKPGGRIVIVDFRFGSLRGVKGRLVKALTWVIERIGGHYAGYRSFRRSGGVAPLVAGAGAGVAREKIVAGGNLAIYFIEENI